MTAYIYYIDSYNTMRLFTPMSYFKVITRPTYTPWNITPPTGPSTAEKVAGVIDDLYRRNYPPFLIVNVDHGYIPLNGADPFTKSLWYDLMGLTNQVYWDMTSEYNDDTHNPRQVLFDIQTVSTGEFEYIRVGDFLQTGKGVPGIVNYKRDFFLFAHKSIVRGFRAVSYNNKLVQADVQSGSDDSPDLYTPLGCMYIDPSTGYKDETCPAILKVFLKYVSNGSGSSSYTQITNETGLAYAPGVQYPYINQPTIVEKRIMYDALANPGFGKLGMQTWPQRWITYGGVTYKDPAYIFESAQVFFQNARVHNFTNTYVWWDLLFNIKDVINNLADYVVKGDRAGYVKSAQFQGIITSTLTRAPFVHRLMVGFCNTNLADVPGFAYPEICACLGRLGVEAQLRKELGVDSIRLVCQSQRCIDGQNTGDVYVFTPSPPCQPINICKPSLNIEAYKVFMSNVSVNCDGSTVPLPPSTPSIIDQAPPPPENKDPAVNNTVIISVSVGVSVLVIAVIVAAIVISRKMKMKKLVV